MSEKIPLKSIEPVRTIAVLALVQLLCSTYFLRIEGFFSINSVLFFIAGIGIAICLLNSPTPNLKVQQIVNKQLVVKVLAVGLLLPVSYFFSRRIMDGTPLQIEYADMLPVMKVMSRRFLDGHWGQVYDPIPEIWNGITPIYLPALWLPFTSALVFHFDMRWVTVCGIWLSTIIVLLPLWRKSLQILVPIGLLILLVWLHFDKVNNVIRLTEEGVVFTYFSLMTVAILFRNPWLIGITAGLCLLSRYSMIGWVPFAILYLTFTKQYRFLIKSLSSGIAITLLLLILPFGFKPALFHFSFPHQYVTKAELVWAQNPEYYSRSLGMAKFFGPSNIELLHYFLVFGTFLIPLLLFLGGKKLLNRPNFLLAGFQLTITFFYNFLDVSYLYLYYTPVFVSMVIAAWLAGYATNSKIVFQIKNVTI